MTSENKGLPVTIEFGGGAELLFDNVKSREVVLPGGGSSCTGDWTLRKLILWLRDNLLRERPELFVVQDTVRPGILVLVNDTDWELLGEGDYVIQPKDKVLFISTLHGG